MHLELLCLECGDALPHQWVQEIQGVFLLVPPRKVLSIELAPPQTEKMTKYPGTTQDTKTFSSC